MRAPENGDLSLPPFCNKNQKHSAKLIVGAVVPPIFTSLYLTRMPKSEQRTSQHE